MCVYKKLQNIQLSLKAPKNQYNAFGKYNYRSCEDIIESVKPLAKENNVVLTLSDRVVQIGNRNYIEATARLIDLEKDDSKNGIIEVTAYAREDEAKKGMDGAQITGASSSYARKYALNGLFAIDDTKDSDGLPLNEGISKPKPQQTKPKQKPQPVKENDYQIIDELRSDMYEAGNKSGFNNEEITKIALAKFKAKPMGLDMKQIKLLKEQFVNNGEALREWLNAKA